MSASSVGIAAPHPRALRAADDRGEGRDEDVVGVVDELARGGVRALARALLAADGSDARVASRPAIACALRSDASRVSSIANRAKLTSTIAPATTATVLRRPSSTPDRVRRDGRPAAADRRVAQPRARRRRGRRSPAGRPRSTTSTPSGRSCGPAGFAALAELVAGPRREWGATAVGGLTMGADAPALRRAGRRRRRQGVLRPQGDQGARPAAPHRGAARWSPATAA